MEKIYYDNSTYIWKTKLNLSNYKDKLLKEAIETMEGQHGVMDTYHHIRQEILDGTINFLSLETESTLQKICNISVSLCKELYSQEEITYNNIILSTWINVVRGKNPRQPAFTKEGNERYHKHTDINEKAGAFEPKYTFVYYIQMPDVMDNDDGVLYFLGENNTEYQIRPEEDDLIIMAGDIPHFPNNAPKATLDRYVLAGNVGFNDIKKKKTLF